MDLIEGLKQGIQPIKKTTVDIWADNNRFLSSESSAEPGRWRTDRVPFLRQIMQDLSPRSGIIEIIVQKGVQLGFTESGLNMVGCYMDLAPSPILYVMPTVDGAKTISKDRVAPMIENSPALASKVKPSRERDSNNTTLVKAFPGGRFSLAGANSGAGLRSKPVRVLVLDEVDAYPRDVDGEGSPVNLAIKRTSTFGSRRKIYKLSTPLIEGLSVIKQDLDTTEVNKFHLPCPFCGTFQDLIFTQLKWESVDPASTTKYQCIHCSELIEERYKTVMLSAGIWVPTYPERQKPKRRGYHINSLYSPVGWLSWGDIVMEWIASDGHPTKMQVFVNTILGETWEEPSEAPPWEGLYNRRENYTADTIPAQVAFLCGGADIQRDRIEMEVVGFCEGLRSYSVDYRVFIGDTSGTEVWNQLADALNTVYKRVDGALMNIKMLAVDSGYNTTEVYRFTSRYDPTRVIPVKGDADLMAVIGSPKAVDISRLGKPVGSVKVWRVGVSMLKSELYGWFRLPLNEDGTDPPGFCHFRMWDQNYFQQITSEKVRTAIDKRGHARNEWYLPGGVRNEALDCRIYARAAGYVCGMDHWTRDQWEVVRYSYHAPKTPSNNKSKGSGFWDR